MYAIFFHAHQKLDRVAYRHLMSMVPADIFFPPFKRLLYFEGQRGPDSTNLKNNPAIEQPWHFVDPFNVDDVALEALIDGHVSRLAAALKAQDETQSAYESAWLAHALVDGLTPAHHYPYEQEMSDIRGGTSRHDRKGLVSWMLVKGDSKRDTLRRSLQLVGPKGLLTTHAMFEGGAYTIIKPLKLLDAKPSQQDLIDVREMGVSKMFRRYAKEIAGHKLYDRFYDKGWTPSLTRDVRRVMAPRMARIIALAWYSCLVDAGLLPEPEVPQARKAQQAAR